MINVTTPPVWVLASITPHQFATFLYLSTTIIYFSITVTIAMIITNAMNTVVTIINVVTRLTVPSSLMFITLSLQLLVVIIM